MGADVRREGNSQQCTLGTRLIRVVFKLDWCHQSRRTKRLEFILEDIDEFTSVITLASEHYS